ncbi:MAG: relaxase domain-containing protein [Deltaproteobacteria bacterium]|nr:relaxase domain-containing protein [Deltaproteobacteria bacterium]
MVSIGNPYNSVKDYEKDNYYMKGGAKSEWWGEGAKALGLSGEVKTDQYQNVIAGKDPESSEQLVSPNSKGEHDPGRDFTFSPDKSFSVYYAAAGAEEREKLDEIFDRSVNSVLDYLERNTAQYRQTVEGKTERVSSQNMVVAKYDHHYTRELDPGRHVHCVIMNMTQRPDGSWRAMSNEKTFDRGLATKAFENEFTHNMRGAGYAMELERRGDGPQKYAVLQGVESRVGEHFSTRSDQINQAVAKMREMYPHASEGELRQMAALGTRQPKTDVTSGEVEKHFHTQLEKLGITREQIVEGVQKAAELAKDKKIGSGRDYDYVDLAAQAKTENESVNTKTAIMKSAADLSGGRKSLAELEKSFVEKDKGGELVRLGSDQKGKELYTTKEMYEIERDIVRHVEAGHGAVKPVMDTKAAEAALERDYNFMTAGQKTAVGHILTSNDRIIGVQGRAGTGKTTALRAVNDLATERGWKVRGISYTGKAVREMKETAGIESETLHRFLGQAEKNINTPEIAQRHAAYDSLLSGRDRADLQKPVTEKDVAKMAGWKSIFLDTKTDSAGGIKQQSWLNASKNDIRDRIDNWYSRKSNPFSAKQYQKTHTYDVIRKGKDGQYERAKQITRFEVDGKAGPRCETLTFLANGDIQRSLSRENQGHTELTHETIRNPENYIQAGKEMWVVDEASMIGSKQAKELLDVAGKADAHIVLVGDTKQLQAINAGRTFGTLQGNGVMQTVEMDEMIRQKEKGYSDVTRQLSAKDIDGAFENLNAQGRLHEGERDNLKAEIVGRYMQSDNALVVTARNADRHEMNEMIRNELKENGTLTGEEKVFTTREAKSMGEISKHMAESYEIGDSIHVGAGGAGVRSGAEGRVTGRDTDNNTCTIDVQGKQGTYKRTIDLTEHGGKLSAYSEKETSFMQGENVIFLKNDSSLGVDNGMTGKVNSLDDQGNMTVEAGEKEITFNMNEYNYIDHGYVMTDYKSQGQTSRDVLIHAPTGKDGNAVANNFNSFYVDVTRGQEDVHVYTDDAGKLQEEVKEEQIKSSTLDHDKEGQEQGLETRELDYTTDHELRDHEIEDHGHEVDGSRDIDTYSGGQNEDTER